MSEPKIAIRLVNEQDRQELGRMRAALWPECSPSEHDAEIAAYLAGERWPGAAHQLAAAIFVAERIPRNANGLSELCGFLEASIRPFAEDCLTHPVGYVEGWHVDQEWRRRGIGRRLIEAAEEWAAERGCQEIASDAHLENAASLAAHRALGFASSEPCVLFRKALSPLSFCGRSSSTSSQLRCMRLVVQEGRYAICRLAPEASLPDWASASAFFSISRTREELSVVCHQEDVPWDVKQERDWRCLRVAGSMDFGETGVLASLAVPLAAEHVPIFAVSTFDTDYLFIKSDDWEKTRRILRDAGHRIEESAD